jgi:hypothetical protein
VNTVPKKRVPRTQTKSPSTGCHWWLAQQCSSQPIHRLRLHTAFLIAFAVSIICLSAPAAQAVTVALSNTVAGKTPEIVGYNSGHFMPGSNTADWWRYSGANGARVWPTPTTVEPTDDLAPFGDGVSSQATFIARETALRADPLNTSYINWPKFESEYANNPTTGSNIINLNYAFGQLHNLKIDTVVEINYTNGSFPWDPAGTTAGWADRWEEWQHFYAQAFYLAKNFDVHRFEMYNEPNGDDIPASEWLERLRFTSDAVQAAVADVNRIYGKNLDAQVQAPVTAGNPITYYPTWGAPVMQNLHTTLFNGVDPNFNLIDTYDYQRYDLSPDAFGSELANVKATVNAAAGSTPMRYAISEMNVHTASAFDNTSDTLDTPAQFAQFGADLVQLANNQLNELYIFKFSQGPGSGPTGVKKNGVNFVDNNNAPYNIGGDTAGGEVVRLFAKSFAGANDLFTVPATSGTGSTSLRMAASHNSAQDKYYLYSANQASSASPLTINLSSWGIATGSMAVIEEVSADRHGEVSQIIAVPANGILNLTQPAQSVFLVSVPKSAPTYIRTLGATDDAMVKAGTNANSNFGSSPNLFAKNDAADPAARNVTFIKFNTGAINNDAVQQAILEVNGQNVGSASQVIAHVYAIDNNNWNESTVTWNTAPDLKASLSTAVSNISDNFIDDIGNTAHFVGNMTGIASSRTLSIDVTDYVHNHLGQQITFLIAREVRFDGENVDDALTSFEMASKERGTSPGPQLLLTLGAAALPGDYDHNGVVNMADYDAWRQNFGTANAIADGNQDGVVDEADFVVWRNNQGASLPGSASASGAFVAAIPEPSPVALAVVCLAVTAVVNVRPSRPFALRRWQQVPQRGLPCRFSQLR